MSDTDSGNEIFITQNTFQNNLDESYDTDNAAGAAFNIMNFSSVCLASLDKKKDTTYPNFSDISDDDLLKATQDIEQQQLIEQCFMGIPDSELINISSHKETEMQTTAAMGELHGMSQVQQNQTKKEDKVSGSSAMQRKSLVHADGDASNTLYPMDDSTLISKSGKVKKSVITTDRFKSPITDKAAQHLGVRQFAVKTTSKVQWAVRLFEEWIEDRNNRAKISPQLKLSPILVPLKSMSADELNYTVCRFISEVRRTDGKEYPGETLRSLILMLQLYMEQQGQCYKLLSESRFEQIRNTLDNIMKENAKKGYSCQRMKVDIITLEEENLMWEYGILGIDNPTSLLNAVFYSIGLNFALRGGEEHRNLRHGTTSQIKIVFLPSGKKVLRYQEDTSKCYQGGLRDYNKTRKSVDIYPNTKCAERCPIFIFEKYISHCPKPLEDLPAFYLRPKTKFLSNEWFCRQAVGRHTLSLMIKTMCTEAGLKGYRTNHSLRSTAATRLFEADIDEQLISDVTGHRSMAVRNYKELVKLKGNV